MFWVSTEDTPEAGEKVERKIREQAPDKRSSFSKGRILMFRVLISLSKSSVDALLLLMIMVAKLIKAGLLSTHGVVKFDSEKQNRHRVTSLQNRKVFFSFTFFLFNCRVRDNCVNFWR